MQIRQGKLDSAAATFDRCIEQFPRNAQCPGFRILFGWSLGQYDSVRVQLERIRPTLTEPTVRATAVSFEADVARLRGKLRDAERLIDQSIALSSQAGMSGGVLYSKIAQALDAAWFLGDTARAERLLDEGMARDPIDKLSMTEAPYYETLATYALAGRVDRARVLLSQWEARRQTSPSIADSSRLHAIRGVIALQSGQYAVAQGELRAANEVGCAICEMPLLARAYDLDGKPDSAIAVYNSA